MSQCADVFSSRYPVGPREPQMVQEEACVHLSQNQAWGPLRPDRIWMTSKIDQLEKEADVKTKRLHLSSWKERFLVCQENMFELISNRTHLKSLILTSLHSSETRNVTFHRRQGKKDCSANKHRLLHCDISPINRIGHVCVLAKRMDHGHYSPYFQ